MDSEKSTVLMKEVSEDIAVISNPFQSSMKHTKSEFKEPVKKSSPKKNLLELSKHTS